MTVDFCFIIINNFLWPLELVYNLYMEGAKYVKLRHSLLITVT
jgi:hypothetical protein